MRDKTSGSHSNQRHRSHQDETTTTSKAQTATRKTEAKTGNAVMALTLPLWSLITTVFSGVSQVKRMVRKEDWTKIMFVYLCLFHVAPGQLCGPSPLAGLERMADVLGKDLNQLLNTLRTQNFLAYQRLEDHWRHYMDCIAMVDTGYFK